MCLHKNGLYVPFVFDLLHFLDLERCSAARTEGRNKVVCTLGTALVMTIDGSIVFAISVIRLAVLLSLFRFLSISFCFSVIVIFLVLLLNEAPIGVAS